MSTAERVIEAVEQRAQGKMRGDVWRGNSPLRAGSDSNAFKITITGPEHGTWIDFVRDKNESGSLYELAERLGVPLPDGASSSDPPPRKYESLQDYCGARYVPAFEAAGWRIEKKGDDIRLVFPTNSGKAVRWRNLSPQSVKKFGKYGNHKGYKKDWYGLKRAVILARDTGLLVLCNGESSVVTAQHEGVPAFCLSGGENNLASLLNDPSTGMLGALIEAYPIGSILIALDADGTGRDAAFATAKVLRVVGYDVRCVSFGKVTKGFDLRDFTRLHEEDTLHALQALPDLSDNVLELIPAGDLARLQSAAALLRAEHGALPAFPLGAFPATVRRFIEAVSQSIGNDPAFAGTFGLAALSTALQGRVKVTVQDGWREQCTLYTLLVAASGTGKSPAADAMLAPIQEIQTQLKTVYEARIAVLEEADEDDKAAQRELQDLRWRGVPRFRTNKANNEALPILLEKNYGRAAILSDEPGQFRFMAGLYTAGVPDIDSWLSAFDGSPINIVLVKATRDVEAPRLTVGISAQPAMIANLKHRQALIEQGLFARFLVAAPPVAATNDDRELGDAYHEAAAAYSGVIHRLYGWSTAQEDAEVIPLHPAGRDLVRRYKRSLADPDGDLESEYALCVQKADRQVIRLAGILHAATQIEQGGNIRTPISADTVAGAIELHRYFTASLLHLLNVGSPAEQSRKAAQKCAAAITRNWERFAEADTGDGRTITPRLVQRGINGATAADVTEGLRWLVDVGLLKEAHTKGNEGRRYHASELLRAVLTGEAPPVAPTPPTEPMGAAYEPDEPEPMPTEPEQQAQAEPEQQAQPVPDEQPTEPAQQAQAEPDEPEIEIEQVGTCYRIKQGNRRSMNYFTEAQARIDIAKGAIRWAFEGVQQ